jgi:hypothetical protein
MILKDLYALIGKAIEEMPELADKTIINGHDIEIEYVLALYQSDIESGNCVTFDSEEGLALDRAVQVWQL